MNKLIIANWKCNPQTLKEAQRFFAAAEENVKSVENVKNIEVVICAPFSYIQNLKSNVQNLIVGAQDCFWEQKGPYTGEVSPPMLKSVGCEYVILGHSERRQYFNETDEIINKKIKMALASRLKPILCVGEKENEREETKQVIENQIKECLKGIDKNQVPQIIFVYEPVWAISTTANSKDCAVNEAFSSGLMIKKMLINLCDKQTADRVKIIYGGSVDSSDAVSYIKEAKMDGVLVGAASLNANEFGKIIKSVAEISN